MEIDFNLSAVEHTEFGVGKKINNDSEYVVVPVDQGVKSALLSMVQATLNQMDQTEGDPAWYEPAEKHSGVEYLITPSSRKLDVVLRNLHTTVNLGFDNGRLSDLEAIFCYFARFRDNEGRRLTAIKRATQFKGVLKSKLLRFDDDTLKIEEDKVFKLDNDFDMLVDSAHTHILRPGAFEILGELQQHIMSAVSNTLRILAPDMPFIDLASIEKYAMKHVSAARYLASIRSQELKGLDRNALIQLCESTGVNIQEANGTIEVKTGSELGFLEVLDRRRYQLELVLGKPERFRASSRARLDGV